VILLPEIRLSRHACDDLFVCGQIDAKRLIVGDIAFLPLDVGPKLGAMLRSTSRGGTQLLASNVPDFRDITFNDELPKAMIISFSRGYSLRGAVRQEPSAEKEPAQFAAIHQRVCALLTFLQHTLFV